MTLMLHHRVAESRIARQPAKSNRRLRLASAAGLSLIAALCANSCFSNRRVEIYYGVTAPPPTEEFRWSDGGLPKSFDPARAAAAPETDVVRALFEGLTEYDTQTLVVRPAAASRWEASPDYREWTLCCAGMRAGPTAIRSRPLTLRARGDACWIKGAYAARGSAARH
ncbi:MAG: hypothetical protein WKF30_07765 [Pyrinomonadaceae bacterium]